MTLDEERRAAVLRGKRREWGWRMVTLWVGASIVAIASDSVWVAFGVYLAASAAMPPMPTGEDG